MKKNVFLFSVAWHAVGRRKGVGLRREQRDGDDGELCRARRREPHLGSVRQQTTEPDLRHLRLGCWLSNSLPSHLLLNPIITASNFNSLLSTNITVLLVHASI